MNEYDVLPGYSELTTNFESDFIDAFFNDIKSGKTKITELDKKAKVTFTEKLREWKATEEIQKSIESAEEKQKKIKARN